MKRLSTIVAAGILFGAAAAPASAAVILGLYNTGVQSGGAGWAEGAGLKPGNGADLHWNLGDSPQAFTGGSLNASWLPNGGESRWLTPSPNGGQSYDASADGSYVYTLSFDLTGYDPESASFSGRFAADNIVSAITLNGVTLNGSGGDFRGWTDFSSVANAFQSGENTLAFTTVNYGQSGGNPTGLRVEFQNSYVDLIGVVPEPATWAMMMVGFGLMGGAIRMRRPNHRNAFA